jgi:uncharacterized protein YgfB (UPF0149 family)
MVEVRPTGARALPKQKDEVMNEDDPGDNAVFDFDELADHLLEQGLDNSPSELHGCLCGLLAGRIDPRPEAGLAALERALDLELHGELAGQMMQLFGVTAAALQDEEFDFYPLLPGDDTDIEERTAALAGWCRGFLAGFAQTSTGPAEHESGEILRDFAAIAEAGVDPDADEDESENSLAELTEYLRIAALNVFMDSLAGENDSAPRPSSRPH